MNPDNIMILFRGDLKKSKRPLFNKNRLFFGCHHILAELPPQLGHFTFVKCNDLCCRSFGGKLIVSHHPLLTGNHRGEERDPIPNGVVRIQGGGSSVGSNRRRRGFLIGWRTDQNIINGIGGSCTFSLGHRQ